MKENEIHFLTLLNTLRSDYLNQELRQSFLDYFNHIMSLPFTSFSDDFLQHPDLLQYIEYNYAFDPDRVSFWHLLATYVIKATDSVVQAEVLAKLTIFVNKQYADPQKVRDRGLEHCGLEMPSSCLNDVFFIKNIYLFGDEKIIALIRPYIMNLPADVFEVGMVPEFIIERERKAQHTINTHLARPDVNLKKLDDNTTLIQRAFRKKLRFIEEKNRIFFRYKNHSFFNERFEPWREYSIFNLPPAAPLLNSAKVLNNANKPYIPKMCDRSLARRIVSIAQKIELYSTIRHITAIDTLENICNDALYGRRNLLNMYRPFKAAAFMDHDLLNGDGNSICFGTNNIDPLATGKIEIVCDLKKVISSKPAAFYKVRDFQYNDDVIRTIRLKDTNIYFSPTQHFKEKNMFRTFEHGTVTKFQIFESQAGNAIFFARIPHCLLASNDLNNMSQILILNFFRFIDKLETASNTPATEYINNFYSQLASMSDHELEVFLTEAGKALTQTAEFNFYGAYKLDFSSIITIRNIEYDYTLNLSDLISSLQLGDISMLQEARQMIPALFKSYRFLDYLTSHTTDTSNAATPSSVL